MFLIFLLFFFPFINSGKLILSFSLINAGIPEIPSPSKVMALLGHKNRHKFVNNSQNLFLSPIFSPSEISIFSTKHKDCMKNAYLYTSGLYIEGNGPTINKESPIERNLPPNQNLTINYEKLGDFALPYGVQPIPVHEIKNEYNDIDEKCQIYIEKQKINSQDPIFTEIKRKIFFDIVINLKSLTKSNKEFKIYEKNLTSEVIYILSKNQISSSNADEIKNKIFLRNVSLISEYFNTYNCCKNHEQSAILGKQIFDIINYNLQKKISDQYFSLKHIALFVERNVFTSILNTFNLTSSDCLYEFITQQNKNICAKDFSKLGSHLNIDLLEEENNKFLIEFYLNDQLIKKVEVDNEFSIFLDRMANKNIKKVCNLEEINRNPKTNYMQNKKLKEAEIELERNYEFITALIIIEFFGIILVILLIILRLKKIL